jgi:hypothetical protein
MVLTVFLGRSKIALKNDYVSPQTVLTATSLVNDSNSSRNGKLFDTGNFTCFFKTYYSRYN